MNRKKKIGMIVPSSNTVVETVCMQYFMVLQKQVSIHFSRVRVTKVDNSEETERQFCEEQLLKAAGELADARVDVILWNGTAGSWRGLEADRKLCKRIWEETHIPATTASLAMMHCYQKRNIKRLAAVTPYIDAVNQKIKEAYAQNGIRITVLKAFHITDNLDIGAVTPEQLKEVCMDISLETAEGIAIICTNLNGAAVAHPLEKTIGIPVVDSVLAAMEEALEIVGIESEEKRMEKVCR